MKSKTWLQSFGHALDGICKTAASERNFRVQLFMGAAAIAMCLIFRVEAWQFILVAFAIFFVLAMELMNTAIEALADLICGDKPHPLAKKAKDAAAGAVLLASAFALVVGAVVAIAIIRRYF